MIPQLKTPCEITFDGYDADDLVVERINIWQSMTPKHGTQRVPVFVYGKRQRRGQAVDKTPVWVAHGSKGRLLKQDGLGARVEVKFKGKKVRGWLTFWFIKELKEEWNAERRQQKEADHG
jgi:hypothetical protein